MNAVQVGVSSSDYRLPLHRRRKLVNRIAIALSLAAMAFGLVWLIWILWDVLVLGVQGINAATFSESTPPPNSEGGGLANAIVGSLMMVLSAMPKSSSFLRSWPIWPSCSTMPSG